MIVTNIQNCQVIALICSSELLMWVSDDHCIEQIFYFDICLTVVDRIKEVWCLKVQTSRAIGV